MEIAGRGIIDQAKVCVSSVICEVITKWRDSVLTSNEFSFPVKAVVWIATEIAFIFNIPLSVIEFVIRGVFALMIVPLNQCGCLGEDRYALMEKFPGGAMVALTVGGVAFKHAIYNLNPCVPLRKQSADRSTKEIKQNDNTTRQCKPHEISRPTPSHPPVVIPVIESAPTRSPEVPVIESVPTRLPVVIPVIESASTRLPVVIPVIESASNRSPEEVIPVIESAHTRSPEVPVIESPPLPREVRMAPGLNFRARVCQIDWNTVRFDESYFIELCENENHPDWLLAGNYASYIHTVFNRLLKDKSGAVRGMSNDNQLELKQRVIAIMNELNAMRENKRLFTYWMESAFARMGDSIENCSNNVNPKFQAILDDVIARSEGKSVDVRVKAILQSLRTHGLEIAVHAMIRKCPIDGFPWHIRFRIENDALLNGVREFYLNEGATSLTYYLARLHEWAGLATPASDSFNQTSDLYSLQNQDAAVKREFDAWYTVDRAVDHVRGSIGSEQPISMREFSDWVQRSGRLLRETSEDGAPLVWDDAGQKIEMVDPNTNLFQRFLVRDYLIEIGVLQNLNA